MIYFNRKVRLKSVNKKMEIFKIEELQEPVVPYELTKSNLDAFLNRLKELIILNKELINEANIEDLKHNKKQIKIKEFIDIIEKYRFIENVSEKEKGSKIVIYKGEPYLSLHICLQAYTQKTKVMIINQSFMNGVNAILFELFKQVLSENKIYNLINNVTKFSLNDFEKINKYYDNTVVIGDSTIYQLLEKNNDKIKFYPYNNIAIYCEDDKLKQLEEAIYIYANENQYEIESINSKQLEEVIGIINNDEFKSVAILITQNETNRERFFYEIKNKEIYVNENPFKKEVGKIYNYLK